MNRGLQRGIWITLGLLLAGCAGRSLQPPATVPVDSELVSTQIYTGNLPCKHCSRIETRLVLNGIDQAAASERTFIMEARYIGHEKQQKGRHYSGLWECLKGTPADTSADVISLLDQQADRQAMFNFQRIDAKTLELIDDQLHRYENGRGLRLSLESVVAPLKISS